MLPGLLLKNVSKVCISFDLGNVSFVGVCRRSKVVSCGHMKSVRGWHVE